MSFRECESISQGNWGTVGRLVRKDAPTSYHLAVTVDDHLQSVTLVTRGEDLLPSTHVHGLLQRLLGYETPAYAHHKLLTDPSGRRFAKRDRSLTLRSLREAGKMPEDVFALIPPLPAPSSGEVPP